MVDPDAAVAGALGGHQGEPVVPVVLCGREQRGVSARGCAPPDPAGCGKDAREGRKEGTERGGAPRHSPRIASCRHSRKHRSCSSPTPPAARRRRVTNAAAVEISVLMSAPAPLPAPPGPAPAAGGGSAQQPHGAGGTGRVCCAGRGGAGPARPHGQPDARTALGGTGRTHGQPHTRTARPAGQRSGAPAGRGPAAPPGPALIQPNGINGRDARPRSRPRSALPSSPARASGGSAHPPSAPSPAVFRADGAASFPFPLFSQDAIQAWTKIPLRFKHTAPGSALTRGISFPLPANDETLRICLNSRPLLS